MCECVCMCECVSECEFVSVCECEGERDFLSVNVTLSVSLSEFEFVSECV